ncbi:MAG: Smr/MutS family protein [Candidatus Krumholzibacteriia bacterium]
MGRKSRQPGKSGVKRGKLRSIRYEAETTGPLDRPARAADAPPAIHLRQLTRDEALQRLGHQLGGYRARGIREVLVVHGRGHNSPGGVPVLGPAVREWCGAHPDLVGSWREAPPRWGGPGAIVVVLRG